MHMFESVFRFLFAWLDKIVGWLIMQGYNMFEIISDINIFGGKIYGADSEIDITAIDIFNKRIYALLAIFMLFKLAFSLITYILNPDELTDKNKGASKIIRNVIVVLLLIISVPYIFRVAFDFQGMIVRKNVINKLILGVETVDFNEVKPGQLMAFTVFSAFVRPNPNYPGMVENCGDIYSHRTSDELLTKDCKDFLHKNGHDDVIDPLEVAIANYDYNSLLRYDVIVYAKKDNQFLFNYIPLISTLASGIIAWVLIMFCFDIAVRVVKLGFLQLIAPIPIISYIDPKSSKEGLFKKWTKVCFSTYADLFLRLLAISFAVFVIGIITTGQMIRYSTKETITIENVGSLEWTFIQIFIIIGALLFAKQLPKLIEDLTGFKFDTKFTLNPVKKLGTVPVIGGAAAAGLTMAGAAITGGVGAGARLIGAGFSRIPSPFAKDKEAASERAKERYDRNMERMRTAFASKMAASSYAASQRWITAGLGGSDKVADVDSARKTLRKIKAEQTKKEIEGRFQGRRSMVELDKLRERGKVLHQKVKAQEGSNLSEGEILFGHNKVYQQSYDDVSNAKQEMYRLKNEMMVVESNYSAAASQGDQAAMEQYKKQYVELAKVAGKTEGKYNYLKAKHEDVRKVYVEDAKIEDAYEAYDKMDKKIEVKSTEPSIDKETGYKMTDSGIFLAPGGFNNKRDSDADPNSNT